MKQNRKMKLAYLKLLEQHDLTVKELPKDARIGIRQIEKLYSAIQKNIEAEITVSKSAMEKLRANDKWIVAEILDYLDEKENPCDDIPFDKDEIDEEIEELEDDFSEADSNDDEDDDDEDDEEEDDEEEEEDEDEDDEDEEEDEENDFTEGDTELGLAIDIELDAISSEGLVTIDIQTLSQKAPTTFDVIFNSYQSDSQNGIVTSKYELLETSAKSEIFKLTLIE